MAGSRMSYLDNKPDSEWASEGGKTMKLTGRYMWLMTISLFMGLGAASVSANQILEYPNGRLELLELTKEDYHPVMTDRMKKVNGAVVSDGAQWLTGELERKLYLVSPGHSSESAYQFFLDQFQRQNISERFHCKSFSCGPSNYWANEVFNIARLYGQDRQQHYFIGEKDGRYYSVYTVKRGNGRIYALMDVFKPSATSQLIATKPRSGNSMDLYLKPDLADSSDLDKLKQKLLKNKGLSAVLQVQIKLPKTIQSVESQQAYGLKQGRAVLKSLLEVGINEDRLRLSTSFAGEDEFPEGLPSGVVWVRAFFLAP